MRLRSIVYLAVAAGFVALIAVPAGAQTGGQASAQAGGQAGATMNSQRAMTPQPREMAGQAGQMLGRMGEVRRTIRTKLDEARQTNDTVKVLCLNDKLNQADTAIKSANERVGPLSTAANRGDADTAGHEYRVIGVYKERVDQLGGEANKCIGQEGSFLGKSQTTSTIDTAKAGPNPNQTINTADPPATVIPPQLIDPAKPVSPSR